MKKNVCKLIIMFGVMMFLIPFSVLANGESGAGQGGGSHGERGGTAGDQPDYYEVGEYKANDFSAFRMSVVYVDENYNWNTLKTVVAYSPETCKSGACDLKSTLVSEYVKRNEGYELRTSGVLAGWAKSLTADHHYIDKTYGVEKKVGNWRVSGLNKGEEIKKIITDNEGFGISSRELTKKNPYRERDDKNSYGYRILIERLMIGTLHSGSWTGDSWYGYLITRRENLQKYGNDMLSGESSPTWDLYTTENDLKMDFVSREHGISVKDQIGTFGPGKGGGYNILWFNTEQFNNADYSLDMACTNCTSTNKTSKAIVLQDTTDWDAITGVDNITCDSNKQDHITKHFKKGGVYCREEYHVFYPNANNKINVQLGRYFTVGANKTQLDIVDGTIPNLAPVKVTKIRECKGEEDKLTAFKEKSDSKFKKCGGTVKIEYHDGTSDDIYKYLDFLTSRMSSFTSVIKNKKLTQQAVFNYSLPRGIYRFVRKSDGRSMHAKDIDEAKIGNYTDLKIGNFPIPINNVNTKNLTVSFQYILPECDSYSDMKTVYDGSKDNDYLLCSSNSTEQNVYKENDKDKLKNTACAKLYNSTTSTAFNKCKNARTSNKMGSCYAKNSGTGKDNYFCDELVNVKHVCEKVDDKYYDDKGNEVDEDTYKKKCGCTITDDGAYHDKDGKETTYEEYTKQCGECNKENHESIFNRDWDDRPESEGGQVCCPEGSKYIEGYGCSNDIICNEDTFGKKIDEEHDYTGLSWTGKECVEPGKPDIYKCDPNTAGKKTDDYDYSDQEYIKDYGCCNKNDVYIKPDGSKACDTRPDPDKPKVCNINNYEEFGRSWNEADGECCPVGYTYIASLKKCEPITDCTTTPDDKCKPETKCDTEHLDCPKNTNNETACCENTSGIAYCGYIINNKVVCPGKPSVMSAVYRTIDPNNAFTSQNGETRQTGANWCSNILAKKNDPTCSGNATATTGNSTVYNSIVARNSKNVDDSDAMYKVVLDSGIINKVRNYNKNRTYDDFTLKCTKGENCKSEFLKTVLNGERTKDGDAVLTVNS